LARQSLSQVGMQGTVHFPPGGTTKLVTNPESFKNHNQDAHVVDSL